MGEGNISEQMGRDMTEIGSTGRGMDMEFIFIKMEGSIRGNSMKTRCRDMECLNGLMGESIKGTELMGSSMGWASTLILLGRLRRLSGMKANL